jgi:hypothetical protein
LFTTGVSSLIKYGVPALADWVKPNVSNLKKTTGLSDANVTNVWNSIKGLTAYSAVEVKLNSFAFLTSAQKESFLEQWCKDNEKNKKANLAGCPNIASEEKPKETITKPNVIVSQTGNTINLTSDVPNAKTEYKIDKQTFDTAGSITVVENYDHKQLIARACVDNICGAEKTYTIKYVSSGSTTEDIISEDTTPEDTTTEDTTPEDTTPEDTTTEDTTPEDTTTEDTTTEDNTTEDTITTGDTTEPSISVQRLSIANGATTGSVCNKDAVVGTSDEYLFNVRPSGESQVYVCVSKTQYRYCYFGTNTSYTPNKWSAKLNIPSNHTILNNACSQLN